jgi:DNA-binding transcriptional LysR family regulator
MNENPAPPPTTRLTLAQLDALRAVILTRGVGEAAKLLGVSQPAVSKLIKQIEKSLGLTLLVKEGNRVLPTAEAEKFGPEVEKLFGAFDTIQRMATAFRGQVGSVCVAAIPTQVTNFLVPAVHELRKTKPWIKVELLVLVNQPVIDAVLSGRADFGALHSITPAPELRVEDLGLQRMVCIAPLGHPYEGLDSVRTENLVGETFVSYGPQSSMGRWLDSTFKKEGASIPVQIEVGASNALIEAVRIGAGVGLIEEGALDDNMRGRLVVRPFEPAQELRSRVISMPGRALTREASALLDAYRAVVKAKSRSSERG